MKKLLLILLPLLLSGCYNQTSLNDIAIVSLIRIDYKDNYIITVEIRENEKDNLNKSNFITKEGTSIESTLESLNQSLNKSLYLVDIDTMILTTNLLNTKLESTLDYLTRQNNIGNNFNILISDENINDIIKIIKNKNKIVGNYLKQTLINNKNNSINIKYNQLLKTYLNEYKDIILPYGTIQDNEFNINKALIKNNDKEIILTNNQINVYNILTNNNKNTIFQINYNNNIIIYRIKNIKTKFTYNNNTINININLIGNYNELETTTLDTQTINNLTNKTKETINKEISDLLNILINNNIDIFGLKKIIYNKTRNKIPNINNINYNINTNIKIEREELTFNQIGEKQ